jgi:DUF1680 family protein
MRLVASLGHYVATRDDTGVQIHQYAPARIATRLPSGHAVDLRMETRYPWEGSVRLTVEDGDGSRWALTLRVPEWSARAAVRVNGDTVAAAPDGRGYLRLERAWRSGDAVELDFRMEPRLIEPHPAIESTRGAVALERGPLVYCLEQVDHGDVPIGELEIDAAAPLVSRWAPELLEGVEVIRAAGSRIDTAGWGGRLYRPVGSGAPTPGQRVELTAIPYYAWANRAQGAMRVWVPRATI